jgi:hypothetical protein
LPQLSPEAQADLSQGVERALDDTSSSTPPACLKDASDPSCPLSSASTYMLVLDKDGSPATVDSDIVASRLTKLLAATRMQLTAGRQVPVGITVNYNISLTGFRGREVIVRWSLYGTDGREAPFGWLKKQPIHWLRGEAETDSASDSFWVPLPEIKGPFYLRLGVYNGDARLTFRDSDTFG